MLPDCRFQKFCPPQFLLSSMNHWRKKGWGGSEFCLLSLLSLLGSVGNPRLSPPSCIPTPFTDIRHLLNQHWGREKKSCHPTFHETRAAWVSRRSVGFRVSPHSWSCFFLAAYPLTSHGPSLSSVPLSVKWAYCVYLKGLLWEVSGMIPRSPRAQCWA